MAKYLDIDGLTQVLGKLTPLNGNSNVMLPQTAAIAPDITTLTTTLKTQLLADSSAQLSAVSKKQFNVIQFYTTTNEDLTKDNNSTYLGYGHYVGNGNSTVTNSIGTLNAYLLLSNGSVTNITVQNINGKLT